jgi:branched-chain amino acid transport system ATP-binding protein
MLRISDLHAGYGQIQVLRGVDLEVRDKNRLGLFGPNGHGKTTLLRTISGLLPPTGGDIETDRGSLVGLGSRSIVESGIVHVPQASALFPEMTVEENLIAGSYARRARADRPRNMQAVFDLFSELGTRRRQLARTLSGGERQMLAIGLGLMGNPEILMLDEPTLGLAPRMRQTLANAIRDITGVTLLVVDQDVEFLLQISDRLALLEHGRIALDVSADEGLDQDRVLEMYFGRVQ